MSSTRRSATSPTASTTTGAPGGSATEHPLRTDASSAGTLLEHHPYLVVETAGCTVPVLGCESLPDAVHAQVVRGGPRPEPDDTIRQRC